MFSPKLSYLNIGNYLSFYEKDAVIFKHSHEKFRNKEPKFFSNHPMSGWKISISKYTPFNARYPINSFFLTHPEDSNISFAVENLFNFIPFLNIENGVIKNEIIIMNDGMELSIAISGTETFDLALQSLNNQSSSLTYKISDLHVGDIVSFKSTYSSSKGFLYLGCYFLNNVFKSYNKSLSIYNSNKKFYFFAFKNDKDYLIIFAINSVKDLELLSYNSSFDNFNLKEVFDTQNLSLLKSEFNLSNDNLFALKYNLRNSYILFPSKTEFFDKTFYIDYYRTLDFEDASDLTEDNVIFSSSNFRFIPVIIN